MTRERAELARATVLRAFDEPAYPPDLIFETAAELEPTLQPEEIKAAVIALLNRGEVDLGWDGRLRRAATRPAEPNHRHPGGDNATCPACAATRPAEDAGA